MSILDAAVMVGVESTYGTPATLTRAFEAQSDTFERAQSRIESVGFRADMQALRDDRVVTVNMGAAGSIEMDFLNKGMGLLLGGALGTKAGPIQQAATAAYLQTYETSDSAPVDSFTIQTVRPTLESGSQAFTYHGCKITGWNIAQSVDGLMVVGFDFDAEDSDHSTAAGTPSYPSDASPFSWDQCTVTLDPDGSPTTLDVLDFSMSADLALKTDRRYLRGSALKKEPVRGGMPSYTGSIDIDFTDTTRYDEWTAETVVDIEIAWTGANIETTYDEEVKIRMQACHWTGGNPKVSLSDTPRVTLPFAALHDGSNAAVSVTYQSTDTAV
jgi:hypothetical protein